MGTPDTRILDNCQSVTDPLWTVLGNDTTNLAVVRRAVSGKYAIEFDKANGAANTTTAGAYRTLDNVSLDPWAPHSEIAWHVYLSTIANVDYSFVRIGTSASHYVEYRVYDTHLNDGKYTHCHVPLHLWDSKTGNGVDWSDIQYLVVGVVFDAETDTLADIAIGEIQVGPSHQFMDDDDDFVEVDFGTQDGAGSAVDSPKTSVGTNVVSLTAPALSRSVTLMADAAIRVGRNGVLDGTANEGYDYLPAYTKQIFPIRPGNLIYFRINAASGTCNVFFAFNTSAQ